MNKTKTNVRNLLRTGIVVGALAVGMHEAKAELRFTSITTDGTNITFQIDGIQGRPQTNATYILYTSTNLMKTNWTVAYVVPGGIPIQYPQWDGVGGLVIPKPETTTFYRFGQYLGHHLLPAPKNFKVKQ